MGRREKGEGRRRREEEKENIGHSTYSYKSSRVQVVTTLIC